MTEEPYSGLRGRIEILERRYSSLVRERPRVREPHRSWTVTERALHWHVVFDQEVLEPDLDFEIVREAIVVRARPAHGELELIAVLPVPSGFNVERLRVRLARESLEVRIGRTPNAEASS